MTTLERMAKVLYEQWQFSDKEKKTAWEDLPTESTKVAGDGYQLRRVFLDKAQALKEAGFGDTKETLLALAQESRIRGDIGKDGGVEAHDWLTRVAGRDEWLNSFLSDL